jgi:hypothetical protein
MSTLGLKAYLHHAIANSNDDESLVRLFVRIQQDKNSGTAGEIPKEVQSFVNQTLDRMKVKQRSDLNFLKTVFH